MSSNPSVSVHAPNTTSVQVALRIRPTTSQDLTSIPARFQRSVIHAISNTTVSVDPTSSTANANGPAQPTATAAPAKKQTFGFDQVHPPDTTQYSLFTTTAAPLISRFIEGFNCTILAYGQTSSGKTYSMTGVDLDADPADPNSGMGIIPRAVSTIFQKARELKDERAAGWQFSIKTSFVEIYNEDLIDLLGIDDSAGARREVQIREDKEGNILWSGLREINVRTAADVMSLLKQGSSIRRTNETDMNAQSSRSHAIFSLTLTQKRFTGTTPQRLGRHSPIPPTPSRLARPGSMYARVGSPTSGRPQTPSFASAMGRGAGGLRPGSAMGMRSGSPDEEQQGEWITVVSKFHFVDLAGSERLKRTAAVGDRIKEGISINSGLLALGNVISALGDPSRSRTSTHVPYRDSKLTRLLQDSLGGNAHTLMIACVSPAEWNVGETVNTLKYANRARNIKNRAEIKEKEEGWDDMEWLQTMVTKLRKEMKALKEGGGAGSPDGDHDDHSPVANANPRTLQKYTELQGSYEALTAQFVERNDELNRLRKEVAVKTAEGSRSSGSSIKRYEEIVGPVIEEYEKTIAAMEAELKLSRTALEHTSDICNEQETELVALKERSAHVDAYVEDLKTRFAKLAEKDAVTENYVKDLESKLKTLTDTSMSSSESFSDLRKEIARYKESDLTSASYIASMEARLARNDADMASLRATIEKLEAEAESRAEEVSQLQGRVDALMQERMDKENWKASLLEREKRVEELEKRMEEWERVKNEVSEERERLGNAVGEVEQAKKSLLMEVERREAASNETSSERPSQPESHSTTYYTPRSTLSATLGTITPGTPSTPVAQPVSLSPAAIPSELPLPALQEEFQSLQKEHSETLADLSSVTSKYRDALREISDLAAQISEAKLQLATTANSGDSDVGSDAGRPKTPKTPTPVRRKTLTRRESSGVTLLNGAASTSNGGTTGTGRRLFFRHATSAESLHSRSQSQSQSLSQELSSRPLSPRSPRQSWTSGDSLLVPPKLSIHVPHNQESTRSMESLEKEIMRLQEVLKEREAEIHALEGSIRNSRAASPVPMTNGHVEATADAAEDRVMENGSPTATKSKLSPTTINGFDELRKSMQHEHQHASDDSSESPDESLQRLNELMLSMAQKESHHREVVEALNEQLDKIRRQHDELTALSRDQALNMSHELETVKVELRRTEDNHNEGIEVLRSQLQQADTMHDTLTAEVEQLRKREMELVAERRAADQTYAQQIAELQRAHADELLKRQEETSAVTKTLHDQHEAVLAQTRDEFDLAFKELSAKLEHAHTQVDVAIPLPSTESEPQSTESISPRHVETDLPGVADLTALHQQQLDQQRSHAEATISQARAEHNEALDQLRSAHEATIQDKVAEFTSAMTALREEHERQLSKANADQADAVRKVSEITLSMERMQEEHDAALKAEQLSRQGVMSESQATQAAAVQQLQDEHALTITRKEAAFKTDLESAKADHERILSETTTQHASLLAKLRSDHSGEIAQLEADNVTKVEELQYTLTRTQEEHQRAVSKLSQDLEVALASAREEHERAMEQAIVKHQRSISKLRTEHQDAISELRAGLVSSQDEHKAAIAILRAESAATLDEERQQQINTLAELDRLHTKECETLTKARDLLAEEVESLKSVVEQHAQAHSTHEAQLEEQAQLISSLNSEKLAIQKERAEFAGEVEELKEELERTKAQHAVLIKEASNRDSVVQELDRHRSVLGEVRGNLQRTKDEMDNLRMEKMKQDAIIQELQAQVAGTISPKTSEEALSPSTRHRPNGIPPPKLPPISPPPSVPPPPIPQSSVITEASVSSHSNGARTSSSSRGSRADSPQQTSTPSTSVILSPGAVPSSIIDHNTAARIEEQNKHIEEQEAMIKTLNKQLTHCESDLQAHMDLVATLETSLTDSERNLRKARMQANEYAKERDALTTQTELLRSQLQEAQSEIALARRSVAEEKQNYESRLDEERKAKERARAQLDSRMDEVARKKSKFACM